jgi:flagellar protein FlgJ
MVEKISNLNVITAGIEKNKTNKIENKEKEDLKKVSQDFEALFLKKLFDEMDKTVDRKDSLFDGGNAEEIFRGMLNDERAKSISKSGGIGLADLIYKQLSSEIKEKK